MLKLRAALVLGIAACIAGSADAAPVRRQANPDSSSQLFNGTGHVPEIDGAMVTVTSPDGRSFSAWEFRAKGEFDVAVSVREAGGSSWSSPVFYGHRNGINEIQPTMTVDTAGNLYLAFTTGNPSRVSVAVLAAGSSAWSDAVTISGTEVASSPALRIVGNRLIVAYRTGRGVGVADIPLVGSGSQTDGIEDAPDPTDGLGIKGRGTNRSDTTPVWP
jgi:hypothetical protein